MGTNGKEISSERFPKKSRRKTKSAKWIIQTKIPVRRKFNFITIIPGKKRKFGSPNLDVHSTQIFKIMIWKFVEKISRKTGNCWNSEKRTVHRKFWKFQDENRMERKFPGNWVYMYPTRLSSFSEILQIRDLVFSTSFFDCDHSELNIWWKDDGDAYSKMETLTCKNHFTYMYVDKY